MRDRLEEKKDRRSEVPDECGKMDRVIEERKENDSIQKEKEKTT